MNQNEFRFHKGPLGVKNLDRTGTMIVYRGEKGEWSVKQHVLIVHKDSQRLRKLRELFVREGYQIMTATNWRTAKLISEKINIELILCEGGDMPLGFESDSVEPSDN